LCDLAPLLPIQQTRKTHPTHTLVYRCRAHRALFVPGTKNTTLHELQTGDRSRANYSGHVTRSLATVPAIGSPDHRDGSRMRRREFITGLGSAVAWPVVARAQQDGRVRRIGLLLPAAADDPVFQDRLAAFYQGLALLGWTIGRNVQIDTRWATANATEIRR